MAEACLDNLRSEFRGDDWGNNGPGVITRVLKKLCKVQQVGASTGSARGVPALWSTAETGSVAGDTYSVGSRTCLPPLT
jgi:hypothetical protein